MKRILMAVLVLLTMVCCTGFAQAGSTPQTDAGEAIGIMCSALLKGVSRNPSEESVLIEEYRMGVQQIKSQPLAFCSSPALGLGIACGGLIDGFARNPSLKSDLSDLYETQCKQEILALKKPLLETDSVLGVGHVWEQYLKSISRNPSLRDELAIIRDMCILDVKRLGNLR